MTIKTDEERDAFEASMRAIYPPKIMRPPSQWEEMCKTTAAAQRIYPEGHWPTDFQRIASNESDNDQIERIHDHHGLHFVPETNTKTVLVTDKETGEQCFLELECDIDPYKVGIENDETDLYIRVTSQLRATCDEEEVIVIINQANGYCAASTNMRKLIDQEIIVALQNCQDYEAIKSNLENLGCMRAFNDIVEAMTEKAADCVLRRVQEERLLMKTLRRLKTAA